jgi:hypothetical protein
LVSEIWGKEKKGRRLIRYKKLDTKMWVLGVKSVGPIYGGLSATVSLKFFRVYA